MPTYKDEQRGSWYCCFYYTDWQGKKQKKLKRYEADVLSKR